MKLYYWILCKVFNKHPEYHTDFSFKIGSDDMTIEHCCNHCLKTLSTRKTKIKNE